MMKGSSAIAAIMGLSLAGPVLAQHTWTAISSPTVETSVNVSENHLTTGLPWDTDANEDCPPNGDDDVRCEWLEDHTGLSGAHQANGVLAATLAGTANELAIFTSDVWPDAISSGQRWWVDYTVHFLTVDPTDLTDLRVTSRFKHAGVTQLTLNLVGQADTANVQYRIAPTHFWTETPETGNNWQIELTLRRTQAGSPAMIWVDDITITEGPNDLFEERFPLGPGDANGDGIVGIEDFLIVLGSWGDCPRPCPPYCPADFDEDCEVGINDFLIVIGNWD